MKETIIILHGWGLGGSKFSGLASEFSKLGYQVFNPDLPGFGRAKAPERPFTLTDYAGFLLNFYKKNGLSKAILVGHSFGGRVALKFSQLYPAFVKCLVLTGAPGFTPIARKKLLLFIVLAKIAGVFFLMPPFNLIASSVRKWYYYFVGARDYFRAEGPMRQTFKNIVREELVSAMQAVSQPCLLVWGEKDFIIPVKIAQKMLGVIRNSKLIVVSGADHGLPFRQPEIFAQKIRPFLNSV